MCDQRLHVLAVLPSVKVFIIADNWFEMKWLSCFFSSACNVCAISPDSLALSAGHVTEMSASPSGFAGKGFSQCWKIQALFLEVAKLCGKYRFMNKVPNCVANTGLWTRYQTVWQIQAYEQGTKLCGKYRLMNKVPNCVANTGLWTRYQTVWQIQAYEQGTKLCGKYRLMNKVPNCVTKVTFLLTVLCVALMYWLTEHKKNKLLTYLPWCMLPWYNCTGWPGIKNNLFTLKCVALCVDRA